MYSYRRYIIIRDDLRPFDESDGLFVFENLFRSDVYKGLVIIDAVEVKMVYVRFEERKIRVSRGADDCLFPNKF